MKKLIIYLPCVILILVALSQIYITHTDRLLTPSKGGGFGMFSTVDKLNNRVVNIYGIYGSRKIPITIETDQAWFKELVKDSWQNARAYPNKAHLKSLSQAIRIIQLSEKPDSLRIEVKKCVFEMDSNKVRFDLVNSINIPFQSNNQ